MLSFVNQLVTKYIGLFLAGFKLKEATKKKVFQ